jgi:hypothetical protein
MAWKTADRVKETSTTTGTGTLNLAGTSDGFQTFVAGIATTNTCYYTISHQDADEWEVGVGTVTDASPDTLSRTTILASSNSGSAVSLSSGTKDVFVTVPASKVVQIGDGVVSGEPTIDLKVAPYNAPSLRVERTNSGAAYIEMATAVSGQDSQLRLMAGVDGKSRLLFGDAVDYDVAWIDYKHDADQMRFRVNATGAMYIDSGQKISIGNNNATADGQLHVESSVTTTPTLVVHAKSAQTANLQEWRNAGGTVLFEVEDDGILDFKQSMGDSGCSVMTSDPSDWVEIKIAGTTYYLPAYPASCGWG